MPDLTRKKKSFIAPLTNCELHPNALRFLENLRRLIGILTSCLQDKSTDEEFAGSPVYLVRQ